MLRKAQIALSNVESEPLLLSVANPLELRGTFWELFFDAQQPRSETGSLRSLPPMALSASRAGYGTTDFGPTGVYRSPRAFFFLARCRCHS